MKTFAFAVSVALCLAACSDGNIRPTPTIYKNYTLGSEQTAYVGQPIIRVKGFGVPLVETFASKTAFSVTAQGGSKIDYPAGAQATVVSMADYDDDNYYIVKLSPELPGNVRLLVDMDGEYDSMALSHAGTIVEPCDDPGIACIAPETVEFTPTKVDTVTSASGNFEIIYSGATKDTINLLYREYTPDDLAKTAFTQNLTYDRASPVIRFRDVQIKVLDANNQSIRFVVEAD